METNFIIEDGFQKQRRGINLPLETMTNKSQLRISLPKGQTLEKFVGTIRNYIGIFKKSRPQFKNLSVHVLKETKEILVYRGE